MAVQFDPSTSVRALRADLGAVGDDLPDFLPASPRGARCCDYLTFLLPLLALGSTRPPSACGAKDHQNGVAIHRRVRFPADVMPDWARCARRRTQSYRLNSKRPARAVDADIRRSLTRLI